MGAAHRLGGCKVGWCGGGRNEELQEGWVAVGDTAGLTLAGEVSRAPESHPSELLMDLQEEAPALSCGGHSGGKEGRG